MLEFDNFDLQGNYFCTSAALIESSILEDIKKYGDEYEVFTVPSAITESEGNYKEGFGDFCYILAEDQCKAALFQLINGDQVWIVNPQLLLNFTNIKKTQKSRSHEAVYTIPQSILVTSDIIEGENSHNLFLHAGRGMRGPAAKYVNPNMEIDLRLTKLLEINLVEFIANISNYVKPDQFIAGLSSQNYHQFSDKFHCCDSIILSCNTTGGYWHSSIYESRDENYSYGPYVFVVATINTSDYRRPVW